MKNRSVFTVTLAMAASLTSTLAFAHVVLKDKQASVGANYHAAFVVEHGCSGQPTTRLRVQIPDGVIASDPEPKDGWTIESVKGAYATPMDHDGTKVSEGIREVSWRGSLSNDKHDDFAIPVFITDQLKPGTTLYFPVIQECGDTIVRWIEIPKDGDAKEPPQPAPGLKLLPKS
jgi:periplasmic copper chaperone A